MVSYNLHPAGKEVEILSILFLFLVVDVRRYQVFQVFWLQGYLYFFSFGYSVYVLSTFLGCKLPFRLCVLEVYYFDVILMVQRDIFPGGLSYLLQVANDYC
ncbi:hypothetical protein SLEP1_g51983 [Rubroshorea leprosula]|uniref:Uncharacterized protein n=1 Tax=Rubroshorea leprosula TaxID=152421 RepID=A0AAV5M5Q1_9ROSI|nr:hypothetical protein SLEP1_g51983 [Rubroshorea leprosula]